MRICQHCGIAFLPKNNAHKFCCLDCRRHHKGAYEVRRYEVFRKITKNYSPGITKCLKCDTKFKSWDVKLNRICPACNKKSDEIRLGVDAFTLETATHFA